MSAGQVMPIGYFSPMNPTTGQDLYRRFMSGEGVEALAASTGLARDLIEERIRQQMIARGGRR